jgi:hypothetical protein
MAQSTITSPQKSGRSRRTLIIAAIAVTAIAAASAAAAIALILDDESAGERTVTINPSPRTFSDSRAEFTSDEIVATAFEHLHATDSFTIRGEFDAWRQYEASNVPPRFEPASMTVHKIHGRSATVVGEFVWPDKFELKFETESQIIEPFFVGRIITPEERARLADGIGFAVPDPIEVPASLITVTASNGQISSDNPDFVARDTSNSEFNKLVLDFISEALGRGQDRWSTDEYLQLAHFEELGVRYHGERLVAGYRTSMPLSRSGTTIFWIDINTNRLRTIETGRRIERQGFDFHPNFDLQNSIEQYAEIVFTYPDETSSRIPTRET